MFLVSLLGIARRTPTLHLVPFETGSLCIGLIVILVTSNFGFDRGTLILITSVPGHCLCFTFDYLYLILI